MSYFLNKGFHFAPPARFRISDISLGNWMVELTGRDLAEIKTAIAEIDIEGERYPEHLLKTTGRQ